MFANYRFLVAAASKSLFFPSIAPRPIGAEYCTTQLPMCGDA